MNQVIMDRELLLEKLNKLNPFIPKKSVTPCFENAKISVGSGTAEVLVSDGQTQLKVFTEARSKEPFSFCVPAKLFIATIALLRENEVTLKVKGNKLELKSGKSKYNITLDTEGQDYPVMVPKNPTSEITLHQQYLKQGLSAAESFIDEKNPLPQLIGVHVTIVDNRIVFTGSIQQMVCRYEVKPISINRWENIVLPSDTAKKCCTMLDKGEVNITHSKDKITFVGENWEVTSTLQDIKYPNTEALFAKCPEEKIIINTIEFSDALKRLKLYTLELPKVTASINPSSKHELLLVATDDTLGKNGEEVMSVINESDKHFKKSYNADQLIQILKNVDNNEFAFHYNENDKKPSQIIPIETKEGTEYGFKFLVVAMFEL